MGKRGNGRKRGGPVRHFLISPLPHFPREGRPPSPSNYGIRLAIARSIAYCDMGRAEWLEAWDMRIERWWWLWIFCVVSLVCHGVAAILSPRFQTEAPP